ncbi:MAG: rhodanese-like domain-containing protein [Desulfobacterales bacterium]|nr:rhodanese-like domain-containing protein [Desulfobacterales bacterium]
MERIKRITSSIFIILIAMSVNSIASEKSIYGNLISMESVIRDINQNTNIILIDVRDSSSFNEFRIPESINIPIYFIKTKNFLKSKKIVLVDNGYGYHYLDEECRNLQKSGFQVSILKGGIYEWVEKKAPIIGNMAITSELNKIPSNIFFEEKDFNSWIVINISENASENSKKLFPDSIHIPLSNDLKNWANQLMDTIKAYNNNPFLSCVLFNDTGNDYEKVEKIVSEKNIKNLFYLKGGLKDYTTFLENIKMSLNAVSKSTIKPTECQPCNQNLKY